jgi:hypothetical protein
MRAPLYALWSIPNSNIITICPETHTRRAMHTSVNHCTQYRDSRTHTHHFISIESVIVLVPYQDPTQGLVHRPCPSRRPSSGPKGSFTFWFFEFYIYFVFLKTAGGVCDDTGLREF